MSAILSKSKIRLKRKPESIDEYLAAVPRPARDALTRVRADIRAAAPEATEKISWGMPTFYHQGSLVGFAAFKNHCSLFVMSGTFLDPYREEFDRYEMTKSAIQFPHDQPLPAALVKKIVRARLAENARKAKQRKRKR